MFVGPLLTILTVWLALEYGMSASGRFGKDFSPNLAIGLAVWLFFIEVVQTATGSIAINPHLVKKVVFPVWVLPVAATLSAFAVHLVVLAVVMIVLCLTGLPLRASLLSLSFWMACLFVSGMMIGLLLATLNVLIRDTAVIAPNAMALLFWLTPIVWPLQHLTGVWQSVVLANPMAAIIEGYRAAFGIGESLAAKPSLSYFTLTLLVLSGLAVAIYRRSRPLFSDSL